MGKRYEIFVPVTGTIKVTFDATDQEDALKATWDRLEEHGANIRSYFSDNNPLSISPQETWTIKTLAPKREVEKDENFFDERVNEEE